MSEYEIIEVMLKQIKIEADRFQLSYHGPNCRGCNRRPSILRSLRWLIEDVYWRLVEWWCV